MWISNIIFSLYSCTQTCCLSTAWIWFPWKGKVKKTLWTSISRGSWISWRSRGITGAWITHSHCPNSLFTVCSLEELSLCIGGSQEVPRPVWWSGETDLPACQLPEQLSPPPTLLLPGGHPMQPPLSLGLHHCLGSLPCKPRLGKSPLLLLALGCYPPRGQSTAHPHFLESPFVKLSSNYSVGTWLCLQPWLWQKWDYTYQVAFGSELEQVTSG